MFIRYIIMFQPWRRVSGKRSLTMFPFLSPPLFLKLFFPSLSFYPSIFIYRPIYLSSINYKPYLIVKTSLWALMSVCGLVWVGGLSVIIVSVTHHAPIGAPISFYLSLYIDIYLLSNIDVYLLSIYPSLYVYTSYSRTCFSSSHLRSLHMHHTMEMNNCRFIIVPSVRVDCTHM